MGSQNFLPIPLNKLFHIFGQCRKYPKTSLEKATDAHPKGPKNIHQCYNWPRGFVNRLIQRYGRSIVLEKLANWRWDATSAFSGIGGAESVRASCMVISLH